MSKLFDAYIKFGCRILGTQKTGSSGRRDFYSIAVPAKSNILTGNTLPGVSNEKLSPYFPLYLRNICSKELKANKSFKI